MFASFEWMLGLRYLRAKRRNGFISFISSISIAGIALGVAALIVVLSVMNGFQKEIRGRILGVASHLELSDYHGSLQQWPNLLTQMQSLPEVKAAAPFVTAQGLLTNAGTVRGVMVRGIEPKLEDQVVEVGQKMLKGHLSDLKPGEFGIVLGSELGRQLGVEVGDKVTLLTPQGNVTPAGMMPRLKQFTVVGLFKIDMYEFDNGLAMIDLQDAQKLFRMEDAVSGIRLKLNDPYRAPELKQTLLSKVPENVILQDWTDMNSNYFQAVELEKRMMFIILTLIVAVAAFNLVSSLVMVVTDKQADIAILRTLGASPWSIMKIFLVQGSISGVLGTCLGVGFGLLLAFNIDVIVPFIERVLGAKLLSSQVYLIDHLPSDVHAADVWTITIISLVLALLATLYPSYRAAKTQPAEALRYE